MLTVAYQQLERYWEKVPEREQLVQELANEKARAQAQLQAALEAQEAEFVKRLERLDPLTKANVPATQTLSLVDDRLSIDKTVYKFH